MEQVAGPMATDPLGADVRRFPYRARAWWNDVVVADSVRILERPGAPSLLLFPREDVRLEAVPAAALKDLSDQDWAAGYVSFDDVRSRVEVVDSTEADAKRWPTWGDAADLIRMLDVVPDGEGYVERATPRLSPSRGNRAAAPDRSESRPRSGDRCGRSPCRWATGGSCVGRLFPPGRCRQAAPVRDRRACTW